MNTIEGSTLTDGATLVWCPYCNGRIRFRPRFDGSPGDRVARIASGLGVHLRFGCPGR